MSTSIRERMLAVYRNSTPDRIPVAIYSRYHRSGEVERAARNNGLGILSFEPAVSLLAPPWHLQSGYVSEVKDAAFNVTITWEGGEQVETRTFETPVGQVSQRLVKDPTFGSDWVTKHYIASPQDYRVMQYVVEHTVFAERPAAIAQRVADLGGDGIVLGRVDRTPYQKLLIELTGPDRLFLDLADQPQRVLDLIEAMTVRLDEQFSLALRSDAEVIWQPDNVTSDMTPPDLYRRFVLPIYQRRGQACREAGKVYAVHLDGRLAALKALIAESTFDVVESFSLAEMAGDVPVAEALAAWPGKVICPNFPASLAGRPHQEIRARLETLAAEFHGRPFMVQISEDIAQDSYASVLPALCESLADRSW